MMHHSNDNGAPATAGARAYYNEIDPFAAQWLRNLIRDGHIAPGDVDERSIVDVRPADLAGYTQCHFFAGIGVWSGALRAASWPDTRRIWTASCPCQPFSAAGKGGGFDDERHLWPALQWLIQQCRPDVVFGEQVASKDGLAWLDLVSTDLEAMGYACGAVPSPASGFGAPHIRQRLYWVADSSSQYLRGESGERARAPSTSEREARQRQRGRDDSGVGGAIRPLADIKHTERRTIGINGQDGHNRQDGGRTEAHGVSGTCGEVRVAQGDADDSGLEGWRIPAERAREFLAGAAGVAGPTSGFWSDADWIWCRDGKYRPIEPGAFPLAHGLARGMGTLGPELRGLAEVAGLDGKSLARAKKHRIGSLKGYGNAVVKQHAAAFIRAYMDVTASTPANDNKESARAA